MGEQNEMNELGEIKNPEQAEMEKEFCAKCGEELKDGQLFCAKCGHKRGEKISTITEDKKKKPFIIVGIAFGVVAIIVIMLLVRGVQAKEVVLSNENLTIKVGETLDLSYTINPENTKNKTVLWSSSNDTISTVNNGIVEGINEGTCTVSVKTANGKSDSCTIAVVPAGPDLTELYNEFCDSTWATVASDGSYLNIDTNPKNSEYSNTSESDAIMGIIAVNEALELPDSVINKMGQTRARDGMQTAKGEGVEISWTYHPDNGLEVMYSLTD